MKLSAADKESQVESDSTTDIGVSELKPEPVEQSEDSQGAQIKKDTVKSFKISNFYFWIGLFLGIGLIVLGLVFLLKKRIHWMIIIVIIGVGFIAASLYYLLTNKMLFFDSIII